MDTEKVEVFSVCLFGVLESAFLWKRREDLVVWKKMRRRFISRSLENWGFPVINSGLQICSVTKEKNNNIFLWFVSFWPISQQYWSGTKMGHKPWNSLWVWAYTSILKNPNVAEQNFQWDLFRQSLRSTVAWSITSVRNFDLFLKG